LNPLRRVHRDEMKVMGPRNWRWLAEPVLDLGLIGPTSHGVNADTSFSASSAKSRGHEASYGTRSTGASSKVIPFEHYLRREANRLLCCLCTHPLDRFVYRDTWHA
jgi:hypothetical protein